MDAQWIDGISKALQGPENHDLPSLS